MSYERIAEALVSRRRMLSLTQDEVASLAGIDRRTLGLFENGIGTRGISLRNLLSLCDVLGLDLAVSPKIGQNDDPR